MQNSNVSSTLSVVRVVVSCLFIALFLAGSAGAQTRSNYSLLVASGFLCDSGESGVCYAVAQSANGDRYELSGAGTFNPQNKSVKAAGTFNHKATNGNMLETGVWTASELISFGSYGIGPNALMQKGPAYGSPRLGPKRMPTRTSAIPTGGLAIFRIVLVPLSGPTRAALLQVNCALGDVPRERSAEGIRLTFERNGGEFSEEVSGRVMFLSIGPEFGTTSKTAVSEHVPDQVQVPVKESAL
jgi:hypothetical protein